MLEALFVLLMLSLLLMSAAGNENGNEMSMMASLCNENGLQGSQLVLFSCLT